MRGAFATVLGYGGSQLLRLGGNLVLTRLLVPEYFGVMALVNVIIIGLYLLTDIGVEVGIIRDPRGDDPAFLDTAWTLQVVRGIVLWLLSFGVAWLAARLYTDTRLLWLIPAVSFSALLAGLQSTSLTSLRRHVRIGRLTALDVAAQAIALAVMIALAWVAPSVWVLTLGYLLPALVKLVYSHWLSRARPRRLAWDGPAVLTLARFGRWIWLTTALTFFASQSDRMILGKLFTFELLGVYGIALVLSETPRAFLQAIAANVVYPSYARLAHLPPATFRAIILKHRWPVLLAMAAGLALLVAGGDLVVARLYDSRYADAQWMLPLLALGLWPNTLTQTVDQALFALGKPQYVTLGSLARVAFTVAAIPLGYSLLGVVGAVLAVALNDLPFYGPVSYGLHHEGVGVVRQDAQATLVFLALLALALWARLGLGLGLPWPP